MRMTCVQTVLETQQETMTEDSAHLDAAMDSGCNKQFRKRHDQK